MTPHYDFDPTPFLKTAARDLADLHGRDALELAAAAITRMKSLGHAEGLYLWHGIAAALIEELDARMKTPSRAIH